MKVVIFIKKIEVRQKELHMTLGNKLAQLRAASELTQEQLAEKLGVDVQVVADWESDAAEPHLTEMRKLAKAFGVSMDDLMNLDEEEMEKASEETAAPAEEVAPREEASIVEEASIEEETPVEEEKAEPILQEESPKEEAPTPVKQETIVSERVVVVPPTVEVAIGVCKDCGLTVTQENVGQKSPIVLCKTCLNARTAEQRRREAEARAAQEASKRQAREVINRRRGWSYTIAGLVAAGFIALMVYLMMGNFSLPMLAATVGGSYVVFSFIFCLFYDCAVQEVVADWFSKSISWPGLIFEFDVDGCLWYIGMKILFFVLGALFGILVGSVGIAIGMIISPFVFPYILVKLHRAYRSGSSCDLL